MKKKLLLALCTLCCMLALAFGFTACNNGNEPTKKPTKGLLYGYNERREVYYLIGISTTSETNIVIPSEYQGKPVDGINDDAFRDCTSIKSVTIPDSVKWICLSAFEGCTSLTDIAFQGTKAEWYEATYPLKQNIYYYLDYDYTIHCTDGDIMKE